MEISRRPGRGPWTKIIDSQLADPMPHTGNTLLQKCYIKGTCDNTRHGCQMAIAKLFRLHLFGPWSLKNYGYTKLQNLILSFCFLGLRWDGGLKKIFCDIAFTAKFYCKCDVAKSLRVGPKKIKFCHLATLTPGTTSLSRTFPWGAGELAATSSSCATRTTAPSRAHCTPFKSFSLINLNVKTCSEIKLAGWQSPNPVPQ